MTSADLADLILEAMGIKAAGQAATAEDSARAVEAITSAHARLRSEGLAPFELDDVPDWATTQVREIVAFDLAPLFKTSSDAGRLQWARQELARQVTLHKSATPTKAVYF